MIVQSTLPGTDPFVMTMDEHTAFAGELARIYGNDEFEPIEPHAQMLYVIEHHDAGWRELDAEAPRDPATGLPYHLVKTPFDRIVATSAASPEFNGKHDPYCGLISSMHSWGLYNGRYGMSDMVLLDSLADENRVLADTMLKGEIARQERLKDMLRADPHTAAWIEEPHLLQNYKQLQFFDTLALYFNCTHEGAREAATFSHVPMSTTADTSVTVTPTAEGVYCFSPWPFAGMEAEVGFHGRRVAPVTEGAAMGEILQRLPGERQTVRLVA